jgi:hypothetical protein
MKMKSKSVIVALSFAPIALSTTSLGNAQTASSDVRKTPALEAAIWGIPIVNFGTMRQALRYFRAVSFARLVETIGHRVNEVTEENSKN